MTDLLRDVAVIIVTYRSANTIRRTVEALPVGRLAACCVVDNASDDNTIPTVQQLGQTGIDLVLLQDNRGFGAGNNVGVGRVPASRWLLFLNPDAVIDADNLERLVGYCEAHPDAAVVGPRVRSNGQPMTSAGRMATVATESRFLLPKRIGRFLPDRRLPASYAQSGPVGYVEGGCMLVDAAVFRAVGGFDERFFLFFEEMDLAQQVRAAGRTVHLCAEVSIEHEVGASRAGIPYAGHTELLSSTVKYFAKWHGARTAERFRRFALFCAWLAGATRRVDAERLADRRTALNSARTRP